jgi:pseudaminic acid synthase
LAIKLGDKVISEEGYPFIVAEMSGNHNHSLDRALEIVDAAAEAGADALKIQTYTADSMTFDISEREFVINDPDSPWNGKSLYDLYKEACTPYDWHKEIQERCIENKLTFFSTPFDDAAVDFLEDLNVPFYKVASFENVDTKLIEKIAKTGKPTIISTGMANLDELNDMVAAYRNAGGKDLILLKCTSSYPADASTINLRTLSDLRTKFGVEVGLSDHSLGIAVPVAAVVLGARVIEKHLTLSRADGGVDSSFSLEPLEFKAMVDECKRAVNALGEVRYVPTRKEMSSLKLRRSLYVSGNLAKGASFSSENLARIRPGLGLMCKHWDEVIGKKASRDIERGTPMSWELIEQDGGEKK